MKMPDVVDLLKELQLRSEAGPNGVTFRAYFDHGCPHRHGEATFRVESGSGIAGRGGAWNVVELPEGSPVGPKVTTKRALKQQILEAIAEEPKPDPRPGGIVYVRRHCPRRLSGAASVLWFHRRVRGR